MGNERYDMYAINIKLDSLGDNIVRTEKRLFNGIVRDVFVETPNKEKSQELVNKFMSIVNEVGFNASVLDVRKKMVCESYEHFLYVRIGSYLYFLSERGVDEIVNMIQHNEGIGYIRQRASEFGIRKTEFSKKLMIQNIIAQGGDSDRIAYELNDLTEKEIYERYKDKI